jgi:hypothetical protein
MEIVWEAMNGDTWVIDIQDWMIADEYDPDPSFYFENPDPSYYKFCSVYGGMQLEVLSTDDTMVPPANAAWGTIYMFGD